MAHGMNHTYLIGALARDPELRYTPTGVAVYEATIAGEDHLIGTDGQERRLPWYHRVTILGKPAEWQAERNLKGGDAVMVEGSLDYSQWEAPEGGKRSAVKVKALRMEQLGYNPELVQDAGGGVRMQGGMNTVMLIGNVVRDPELRYTPAGDAILTLGLAVNERWTDRQGQKQEKTHWIDVTLWREVAEAMKDLRKGDPVLVQGRLVNESWQDKDGLKRNTTKVEAFRVDALARGTADPAAAPRPARPAPATAQREPVAAGAFSTRRAPPRPAPARSGGLDQQDVEALVMGLRDLEDASDAFPPEEEDLPF